MSGEEPVRDWSIKPPCQCDHSFNAHMGAGGIQTNCKVTLFHGTTRERFCPCRGYVICDNLKMMKWAGNSKELYRKYINKQL